MDNLLNRIVEIRQSLFGTRETDILRQMRNILREEATNRVDRQIRDFYENNNFFDSDEYTVNNELGFFDNLIDNNYENIFNSFLGHFNNFRNIINNDNITENINIRTAAFNSTIERMDDGNYRQIYEFTNENGETMRQEITSEDDIFPSFVNLISNFNRNEMSDVPIVITNEDFNKLNRIKYESNMQLDDCVICMDNYINNDIVIDLPCHHKFHEKCIENWLKNNSYKCPICRAPTGKSIPLTN